MERKQETAMKEAGPEIATRRLTIRRFEQDEWPLLLAYLQDDGVADAFPEGIYTEQRLREMTADRNLYALIARDDGRLIGHAALNPGMHPASAAFSLGVVSSGRRLGYGEEAARALLRHAFAEQNLHRVTLSCPPENLALRALLEKLGMRMEAFFRRSVLTVDGEWHDECVYALLADEWRVQESLSALRESANPAIFPGFGTAEGFRETDQAASGEGVIAEEAELPGVRHVASEEVSEKFDEPQPAAEIEASGYAAGENTEAVPAEEAAGDERDRDAFDDIAALAIAGAALAETETSEPIALTSESASAAGMVEGPAAQDIPDAPVNGEVESPLEETEKVEQEAIAEDETDKVEEIKEAEEIEAVQATEAADASIGAGSSASAELSEAASASIGTANIADLPEAASASGRNADIGEPAEAVSGNLGTEGIADLPSFAEAVEPAELPEPELSVPIALPDDPDIPQVTLALGEAGGGRPFAPILPLSLSPSAPSSEEHPAWTEPELPGDLIEQRIDEVPFVLRRPHDFNWLAPFGQVFRVWDRQDSGNLAFGLTIEDQKVFIKYAGAFTAEYDGHPVDAVRRLREAAGVYEVLRHPALVRVLDHFETTDGYAVLYEWAEGKLLRPGAEAGAADAVISRFRRLPIEERIEAMDTILDFHAYVEALNYVAIDFYDGSLIYDFEAKRMTICDIDFYRPKPYTNEMGRMWGSSRFMSPEEHEFGATIDSRTNVYTMGAMAFHLLGGERDRSRDLWEAGDERYEIALRAVSPERAQRWESVDAMLEAWLAAK